MSTTSQFSLRQAILINLNIIISTGIFINMAMLPQKLGFISAFIYPLMGLIMLPLIATIGSLLNKYPSGGFYAFAKDMSPFLGFISCWSFFFAKLASSALMLFFSITFFQQLFPALQILSAQQLCLIVLAIFTILNVVKVKVATTIQSAFLYAKSIPLLTVIISGIIFLLSKTSSQETTPLVYEWQNLPTTIPVILYCLVGFETACSISRHIKNPQVNAARAIYISFGAVVAVYAIFQTMLYFLTYTDIAQFTSYKDVLPFVVCKLGLSEVATSWFLKLLYLAIGSSALGGSYGILFSNSWNLVTLAEAKHTFMPSVLTKLNTYSMPVVSICIESLVVAGYIMMTVLGPVPLQQTAAFGVTIAYTISVLAAMFVTKISPTNVLAFITCSGFIASCIAGFINNGIQPLLLFIGILLFGICMFYYKNTNSLQNCCKQKNK